MTLLKACPCTIACSSANTKLQHTPVNSTRTSSSTNVHLDQMCCGLSVVSSLYITKETACCPRKDQEMKRCGPSMKVTCGPEGILCISNIDGRIVYSSGAQKIREVSACQNRPYPAHTQHRRGCIPLLDTRSFFGQSNQTERTNSCVTFVYQNGEAPQKTNDCCTERTEWAPETEHLHRTEQQ